MRRTGLDILGSLPWATHFCQFYRSAEDLLNILVPYFRCGLEDRELCMWVVSPPLTVERAAAALRRVVPDFDLKLQSGQMELVDGAGAYTAPAGFNAEPVIQLWKHKEAAARQRGLAGFRLSGNVSGVRAQDWPQFMAYEREVDQVIHSTRMLVACGYSLEECGPAEVIDVVSHHAFALVHRGGKWDRIENQEYRRVRHALDLSDQRFRMAADHLPQAMVIYDADRRIQYLNKMALAWMGKPVEQLRGRRDEDLHPSEVTQQYLPALMAAYHTHRPQKAQFEVEAPHVNLRHRAIMSCTYTPVLDDHGAVGQVIALVEDATQRKLAERATQESEEQVRRVLDNLFAFVALLTPDGTLIEANRAPLDTAGISIDDVYGKPFWECYWWSYSPAVQQRIRDSIERAARGEVMRFDIDARMAQGRLMTIDFQIKAMRDENGQITHLIPSAVDVTQRTQAQEGLRRRAEELQILMDLVPVAIWVAHDPQCRHITGNRMANTFYEAAEGDNVSANPPVATTVPPRRFFRQGRELTPQELPMQIAAAQGIDVNNAELDVLLPSGRRRSILGSASPLRDAEGRVRGCLAAFVDITQRKQAEAERDKLLEAAEEANRAKDQFIAALSHELRTPLTPVLAAASVMKNDPRLTQELREDLTMIERNVGLEVQLIADLLDVTKIAAGKLLLEKRLVDAGRVLREAARICSSDIDAHELQLILHLAPGPLICEADEMRLHQVFWNLLRNAIKFTPRGGRIEVTARRIPKPELAPAQPADGWCCVGVTDTGCGIEPERIGRLFRAFEQGSSDVTRRFGGLGLGLAICKAVVELHGGHIAAASPGPNQGATFTVELPLAPVPDRLAARGAICDRGQPEHEFSRTLKILLVEDHADTARLMQRLLTREGHAVRMADTVATALEAAQQQEFDVVVSDLGLPDGSGHDLLRELLGQGRQLKAIALSGYGAPADIEASRKAGFAEHIVKPVSFDALHAALVRLVNTEGQ